MAKRRSTLEDRLARLAELREEGDAEVVRRELRRSLGSRRAPEAAKAARLARELGVAELVPEMAAAFERFLAEPVKSDKGCVAKTAIARTLFDLEEPRGELYLRGARHVQQEPAYGGPVDTAAELRGICALGLALSGHPDAVLVLVDLLVDPEWTVRANAARALGGSGRLEAEALLRLKALQGDRELDVLSECFGALLELAPERSLGFVAGFLKSRDLPRAEAAALALGESRLEGAVEALRERYAICSDAELRRTLLLAIAMTRREPALDFLVGLAMKARRERAAEALAALAVHRHDERVRERIEAALAERADAGDLRPVFEREFRVS